MLGWLVAAVLAIASALALAILARLAWEIYGVKWLARFRAWNHGRKRVDYDGRADGMYMINSWSPERRLKPRNLDVTLSTERPASHWVEQTAWERHYADLREQYSGRCGYVTGVGQVDFREGPTTEVFRVQLSPCDYAEGLATWKALTGDPEKQKAIADALSEDPFAFAASSPPHPLAINVAVLSPADDFSRSSDHLASHHRRAYGLLDRTRPSRSTRTGLQPIAQRTSSRSLTGAFARRWDSRRATMATCRSHGSGTAPLTLTHGSLPRFVPSSPSLRWTNGSANHTAPSKRPRPRGFR